jgi:hypothetical protein
MSASSRPMGEPITWLWVWSPEENRVILAHNEGRRPALRITHREFATHVAHPSAIRGFAYRIPAGWRITNRDHGQVEDPYVVQRVLESLRANYPD